MCDARKHPFFLIEVLIVLSLISLVLIPLLRAPIAIAKWEMEKGRKIQFELAMRERFQEVREQLYEGEWWRQGQEPSGELSPFRLQGKEIPCSYTIEVTDQRDKSTGDNYRNYRLLKVIISLEGEPDYESFLFVERLRK